MLFHAQTSHILNESSNFDVLKKSAEEIRNILEEMTGIDGNDLNAEKDIDALFYNQNGLFGR